MAVRCEITQWTIELMVQPVTNPPRGGVLVFEITNVTGVNISGDVFEQTGGPRISTFRGTCRAAHANHLNVMTFEFVWGAAEIFLAGVAFPSDVNRLIGRFRAEAHVDALEGQEVEREALVIRSLPPEEGDVGTGNGTQT